jgi:hypothetical protein
MTLRSALWLGAGISFALTLYGFQRPWRLYRSMEPYDNVDMPADWQDKTEWVFGRLMYPQHFALALRRLTRISVRSVEQPVNLDDGDDVYNWPWLCAGEMGDWKLTDSQVRKLRDYLLRGGFLMLDDFWGSEEWGRFYESMRLVFPDRPVVEIPDADSIFHTVYDLDDRYQVPGEWALRRGLTYRNGQQGGAIPHWRGIMDDKGRVMVAMSYNSDIGDSWEWADDPEYPEVFASMAFRISLNYIVYGMTH